MAREGDRSFSGDGRSAIGIDGIAEQLAAEQERWFLWVPVLFGAGIAVYFGLATEPAFGLAMGLVATALLLKFIWRDSVTAIVVTACLLVPSLGFAAAKIRTERVAAPVIAQITGRLAVTGWIELIEARPQRGQRLTIRVASLAKLEGQKMPTRVRVRTLVADPDLKPGDGVRLNVMLSPPAGPALPGGFDFSRSAWFHSLGAVGYARDAIERVEIVQPMPWDLSWRAPVERLRQAIGRRIAAALPGETGAIATALITGERGGISDATNEAYRDSGLLHILSISGLHMVIMAGAVFVTVRVLLNFSPALALRYPIKKWAAAAAAIGAFSYLLISGASFPTVRSYIMISIMFLAVLLDRPAVALRNVALAALVILVLYPESLIDVGFQMSFAAVTALVAVYEAMRDRERRQAVERGTDQSLVWKALLFFGGILLSTLIAGLSVAPFAAFHFHKSQQFAMIANLIAIPICNILVMPAALAALVAMPFGLEAWPLRAMGLGIEAMTWCAFRVSALPGAVGRIAEIPTSAFGLMTAGGLWVCLWRQRWRYAGAIVIVAGLLVAPLRWVPDIYIGRDGLVAVRAADGRLNALSPRGALFDLARILEHDGDGRRLDEVAAARGFRCDWSGCIATARGQIIAVTRHYAALADDCGQAAVLIMPTVSRPATDTLHCAAKSLVDAAALLKFGAHAIRFERAGESVGGSRLSGTSRISGAIVPGHGKSARDLPPAALDQDAGRLLSLAMMRSPFLEQARPAMADRNRGLSPKSRPQYPPGPPRALT